MTKLSWVATALLVALIGGGGGSGGSVMAASDQQPTCAPSTAPVRVLAFGDSLTNGAVPSLNANHPYSLKLGELLRAELGAGGRRPVEITTVGARAARRTGFFSL